MERSDFDKLKAEIIQKFGKPESDNGTPLNESARRISELCIQYRVARNQESRAKAKETKLKLAAELAKEKSEDARYEQVQAEPVFLSDKDMLPFTEQEALIVRDKFENFNIKDNQLAHRHHTTVQKVTALWTTEAFKYLQLKLQDKILPMIAFNSLMRFAKTDAKVALRIAEHYKMLKSETLDINNTIKPIEDPEALKRLKELGDNLV